MDAEMREQFQAILSGMEAMENRVNARMDDMEKRLNTRIEDEIRGVKTMVEDEIRGVKVLIENDVGKRLDALFDGYQLVHEKQWALEKAMQKLQERVERLESIAG